MFVHPKPFRFEHTNCTPKTKVEFLLERTNKRLKSHDGLFADHRRKEPQPLAFLNCSPFIAYAQTQASGKWGTQNDCP